MQVKSLAFDVWEWRRCTQLNPTSLYTFRENCLDGRHKKTQLLQESVLNGHFAYARITFLVHLTQMCKLYPWRVASYTLEGSLLSGIWSTLSQWRNQRAQCTSSTNCQL